MLDQTIDGVDVDIAVVLGTTRMPVHQLLRMGRGAVIELAATEHDDVTVLANDVPIAKASIRVDSGRIAVAIKRMLARSPERRDPSVRRT